MSTQKAELSLDEAARQAEQRATEFRKLALTAASSTKSCYLGLSEAHKYAAQALRALFERKRRH